jgi:hypothetical protein
MMRTVVLKLPDASIECWLQTTVWDRLNAYEQGLTGTMPLYVAFSQILRNSLGVSEPKPARPVLSKQGCNRLSD